MKLHVSAFIDHLQVSSTRPHTVFIDSFKVLWKPADGQQRPKHVVPFLEYNIFSKQFDVLSTVHHSIDLFQ